jgi:hypothetical protein
LEFWSYFGEAILLDKISSVLKQEQLPSSEYPEKQHGVTDNLAASERLFRKTRISIRSVRTSDEMLRRSLNALKLSCVQHHKHLR